MNLEDTERYLLRNVKNDWVSRGSCIQATFWELRKSKIKNVRKFTSAVPKPDHVNEIEPDEKIVEIR